MWMRERAFFLAVATFAACLANVRAITFDEAVKNDKTGLNDDSAVLAAYWRENYISDQEGPVARRVNVKTKLASLLINQANDVSEVEIFSTMYHEAMKLTQEALVLEVSIVSLPPCDT